MVDKNKLERKRRVQQRLARLRRQIEDRRCCINDPSINTCERVEVGLQSEIAVLNAERIDLDTELDVLVKELQHT